MLRVQLLGIVIIKVPGLGTIQNMIKHNDQTLANYLSVAEYYSFHY